MGPLVDTSVLIDYFAGTATREADALERLFAEGIPPATAPVIVQEFLQGFSRLQDLDSASLYLSQFERLPAPTYQTHADAATLHRLARRQGHTIPTVDTLIVELARAARLTLLTADAHQRRLAPLAGVELVQR
jgi:predicted nucleic acid-binding protein